jgi:hypothetical protein
MCKKPWPIYASAHTYTKVQRIRRHDEIKDFVSNWRLPKEIPVVEALIETSRDNLKPYLVVINQGRAHVVNVNVRHEDTDYLEKYRSKVDTTTYNP